MYDAIIVEDEFLVRIGIKSFVNWQDIGINLVGEAENGKEAYNLYQKYKPQIIITDLKMPVMDGITLIQKIRIGHQDKLTKFIILSCMDEFALVQKALNYNVSHYFLKIEMTCKDFQDVLKSVVDELDNQKVELNYPVAKNDKQAMDELIRSCYENNLIDYRNAKDLLSKTAIDFDQDSYLCAIIHLFRDQSTRTNSTSMNQSALLNLIAESIGNPQNCLVYYLDYDYYCLFIQYSNLDLFFERTGNMLAVPEAVQNNLHKYANARANWGLSRNNTGICKLSQSLKEAKLALEGCYFKSSPICQFAEVDSPYALENRHIQLLLNVTSEFIHLSDEFISEYQAKVRTLASKRFATKGEFKDELTILLFWITAQVDVLNEHLEQLVTSSKEKIGASVNLNESVTMFLQFVRDCILTSSFNKRMPDTIKSAINYISEHSARKIYLEEVAKFVHLNSSYLSSLFKRKMHCSFIEYVNIARVKKAQKLLVETDQPIYFISQVVGFPQEEYFYKIFKRITQLTPSEYRSRFTCTTSNDRQDDQKARDIL
ncbi:MAG TPA: hypothetical protein DD640_06625 [Clostridiales bacterium]|nr:hypothetical protein [Clostridiales bacterium]